MGGGDTGIDDCQLMRGHGRGIVAAIDTAVVGTDVVVVDIIAGHDGCRRDKREN